MTTIGIDLGGTKISAGLLENGIIVKNILMATPVSGSISEVIESIVYAVREVWSDDVASIGIGVPGLVDVNKGIVYDATNIPAFTNINLKEQLENILKIPVYVANDANCFVLGAKQFDKGGLTFNNMVGLTLGTGLGGGVIINNKLHEGVGSGAGELGYIPYLDGILEHYCSGQFFQGKGYSDGLTVSNLAAHGNKEALALFNEFGTHLGVVIKITAHMLAPEAIILGGSISSSFKFFEESMWKSINTFPYRNVIDNLTVTVASAPNLAVSGAASLALQKHY